MAQLKISELFYSIQGEGRYMGVPSVFLRTFGCNFTCAGFGMPKGEVSKEVEDIAARVHYYDDYKKLPLVSTGCDSYASWDPRFKHLSPVRPTDDIVDDIMAMLPHNRWISQDLSIYLQKWKINREKNALTFSVSPKLSISGEKWEEAICPEIIRQYESVGFVYLKFVIATKEDALEADKAVQAFRNGGFRGPVYFMPCGGVESIYSMNAKNVAIEAMNRGYRYSDRLQVPLFKNEWGT